MRLRILSLALCTVTASAIHIPLKRSRRSSSEKRGGRDHAGRRSDVESVVAARSADDDLTLDDVRDLIYMANVTVGGIEYPVQLDTGSSDLWIQGSNVALPNTTRSSATLNLTYSLGWAYGYVSFAPTEFSGISIASQAFLDVSLAQNAALSYDAEGILGLGFTSLSNIDSAMNQTGSSSGRSLLYNLFQNNPNQPNFISFTLERTTGNSESDSVPGTFSVGEYEPQYTQISSTPAISTWPVQSPSRWTVLLNALLTPEQAIYPSSNVTGTPSNTAVVLLDSGTSWTYAPSDICTAIYGDIPGAIYNSTLGQWTIPCDAEVDIALQFGDQVFPIHPLDVTMTNPDALSTCVGTFVPQFSSVGDGSFDWLVGDNVLRSLYTIYDYGDFSSSGAMGNPYVKLLSLVDPTQASVEFHAVRGGSASTNVTYNAASGSGSGSVIVPDNTGQILDKIDKYIPAMLGIMALNALALLVLAFICALYLCQKGKFPSPPKFRRRPPKRLTPTPMNRLSAVVETEEDSDNHVYQPVSMALTEDTLFVPPSPAFRGSKGSTLRPGDRPNSIA